jgi:hypothetical protein
MRSAIAIENKGLRGAGLEGVILHPSAWAETPCGRLIPYNRRRLLGLGQISRQRDAERF